MKTFSQSLVAALLLSTATFASTASTLPAEAANPTVSTHSYKVAVFPASTTPNKLNVIIEREPGKAMSVYLKDASGRSLARQRIDKKSGNCRFVFNLKDLEDGGYKVEVVCGSDKTVHPVTLTTPVVVAPTRIIALN